MPRRKQQDPRRSAAYVPEDELKADLLLPRDDDEEHLQDDGLSLDGHEDADFLLADGEDGEDLDGGVLRPLPGYRGGGDSSPPLSNGTNPDAGYGSPLSDASDRLADFKGVVTPTPTTPSSRDGVGSLQGDVIQGAALPPVFRPNGSGNNGLSLQDSLAQMKAVYANLISDASWSSIAMDITKSKPAAVAAAAAAAALPGGLGGALAASAAAPTSTATKSADDGNHHHNGKNSAASVNHTTTASGGTANGTSSGHGGTGNGTAASSNGGAGGGGVAYDWHQAALAKTFQQNPYHLLPEPSLFSTVQLYRQNNKLYGSVFTGASKFRCKDCSAAYDTLVGLTVHMNETGHYRDDNKDKDEDRGKRWSKPRKRSLMEMEGKEDAQKVLKCMYCGHSFESLQDLSVHMIKTKHYQKVPLKEPMPALAAAKLVPPTKKRAFQDLVVSPGSPDSVSVTASSGILLGAGETHKTMTDQKLVNPYVTANNRYGYQNGASYTWQFEARKAQILKCMECGSSHDTLQQLTAHMMVTGHFLKVTNSASKKGKQLVFDPVVEEKIQSIPLPPTTTRLPAPSGTPSSTVKSQPESPLQQPSTPPEERREEKTGGGEAEDDTTIRAREPERKIKEEKEDPSDKSEKPAMKPAGSYQYLREEDLGEESPKGGLDILKSLENTVSSAISKAQTGTPTWGGYPSIHAAYQLHGTIKSPLPSSSCPQVQPLFSNNNLKALSSSDSSSAALIHSPDSPSPPPNHKSNVLAMEELVEKVTGNGGGGGPVKKEREERPLENLKCKSGSAKSPSPSPKEKTASPKSENLVLGQESRGRDGETTPDSKTDVQVKSETPKMPISNGCNSLGIITDHSPEHPLVNPLSALQSIMNNHLGKASKAASPFIDPFAMLYKLNSSIMEKPIVNSSSSTQLSSSAQAKPAEAVPNPYHNDDDQPMDLTKSKNTNSSNGGGTANGTATTPSIGGGRSVLNSYSQPATPPGLPLRENALMDISDMVKNLTGRLTPKSTTPSSVSEKSDLDGSALDDGFEELSPIQRRKGRQSNWNPQHLLILQAQFASSLREAPDGKFVITDLGPQERVHICKFTGLSMTTISHWLANVKYQLRRTGGTKFLKNIDSGQPLFLCSDCASQFRTPTSYISHLESHLGFTLKDLSKLAIDFAGAAAEQQAVVSRLADKAFGSLGLAGEEDSGTIHQCKLCSRTFVSKHAIKLHLCKTHGKSPEDHLIFVKELDKYDKL